MNQHSKCQSNVNINNRNLLQSCMLAVIPVTGGWTQMKFLQMLSPIQSPLTRHCFFWHPIFSSLASPKNPSGQVQTGRWLRAVHRAFLPQMTGPAQTFSHSKSPFSRPTQVSVSPHSWSLEHRDSRIQTPPDWQVCRGGHWLSSVHLLIQLPPLHSWLSRQSLEDWQGGEQMPKLQSMPAGHCSSMVHSWSWVHPRVGSPVNPGRQKHLATWLVARQSVFCPHTLGRLQTSTHLFLTHVLSLEQSEFPTHSRGKQRIWGLPLVRGGQEHIGRWLAGVQMASAPQDPGISQGFWHLPLLQTAVRGQSLSARHWSEERH